MRQHPLTKRIAFNYWILGREIQRITELKKILKKVRNVVTTTLELAKQIQKSDLEITRESSYITRSISDETISALEWELQYIEGEIYLENQRIKFLKNQKVWIPLG